MASPTVIGLAQNGHSGRAQVRFNLDAELYKAAEQGNSEPFVGCRELGDRAMLTASGNTILHVHITARTKIVLGRYKRWNVVISRTRIIPLGRYQRWSVAAVTTSNDFVRDILTWSPGLLDQTNSRLETPLHLAARYGHADLVELLLDRARARVEASPLNGLRGAVEMLMMTTLEGNTALHEAVMHGHLRVVQKLTDEPSFPSTTNRSGETPLYLAADRCHRRILSCILEKCSSPVYDGPNGRTALHAAVIRSCAAMTKEILESNNTLPQKIDEIQGWTPLHHASHFGDLPLVSLLLEYDKSAAYIRDSDGGRTALHIAVDRRHVKVMEEIISRCPDCSEIVDDRGWNILHFAVSDYSSSSVRSIMKNSSVAHLVNQKDNEGNTPLHLLAALGFHCNLLITHPLVDQQAVNALHQTAVDSLLRAEQATWYTSKSKTWHMLRRTGYRRSWQHKLLKRNRAIINEVVDFRAIKTAKDAQLIAATLIATVSFAASFTLPGGYVSGNGPDQGTAQLASNAAFRAFVVADNAALALSTCSVFINLLLATHGNNRKIRPMFTWAYILTGLAMGLMLVAFTAGLYVVLPHSGLSILSSFFMAGVFFVCFLSVCYALPFELFDGTKLEQRKLTSPLMFRDI